MATPHRRLTLPRAALFCFVAAALAGMNGAKANSLAASRCDFDNDGFEDLALGVPGENIAGIANAGAVNVIYGTANGLTAPGNQMWHQNSGSIAGVAEPGDAFGSVLICGNFNVDQYDDLAIGAPGEDVGRIVDAGAVHVLFGGASGLSAAGNQMWDQNDASIRGAAEAGDRFGAALAAGDFDDDAADDLAIGIPGEDIGGLSNAGAVSVLYGGDGGLTALDNQLWHQDSPSVIDSTADDDSFGAALAAGDFDDDGFDDLAIGVPGEDLAPPGGTAATDAGAVNVLNGSGEGLASDRDQFWSQIVLRGAHESGDNFGYALAAGDFDDDEADDLAVGVPGEDLGDSSSAGAVNVIYGSASLLTLSGNQIWHQDSASVVGVAEEADAFGASLAVADFDGDRIDDLAIGVLSEDIGTVANAGAVQVLFGTDAGLNGSGSLLLHQNSPFVAGVAEPGNVFGSSLAAGNFNGDDFDDLVAGVPGEALSGITSAGAANVLYGSGAGPTGVGDEIWHQDSPGILGAVEHYDRLGSRPLTSDGRYRIPYADGTDVLVTNDHFSHSPDFSEIDMHGEPNDNNEQYTIVAAAAGTIMAIEDSKTEPTDLNNYVWIAHANGEWTKYTHFEAGSVTLLGLVVGSVVSAGTPLGFEGNVGQASSVHLHFEVAVPDDLAAPLDDQGFIIGQTRVPLICGISGNVLYDGSMYTAAPCS